MSEHTAEKDAMCQRQVVHPGGREGACNYPLPCWRHPEQTRDIPPANDGAVS